MNTKTPSSEAKIALNKKFEKIIIWGLRSYTPDSFRYIFHSYCRNLQKLEIPAIWCDDQAHNNSYITKKLWFSPSDTPANTSIIREEHITACTTLTHPISKNLSRLSTLSSFRYIQATARDISRIELIISLDSTKRIKYCISHGGLTSFLKSLLNLFIRRTHRLCFGSVVFGTMRWGREILPLSTN